MLFERIKQRVLRVKALHPHLAVRALRRIAPGPAAGLHQQTKQALRRPEVAGKQRAVGVDRGHQRDVPEVMALGNHLRAHQHIDLAGMHAGQLRLERALEPRGVSVNARNHQRAAVRPCDALQQLGQVFFEPLGAAAHRGDVHIAARRAGARHALGEAAVMAAQRAVYFVKHPVRAAMRAFAFPAAVVAGQHGCVAAPVQKNQ